jgi:type II secretory ATPase GspE/PulE/Tfp pilus assembly ATPase PilB-like protein
MKFTDKMKQLVFQNCSPLELKAAAIEGGMRSLRMNGIRKINSGLTTIEEVIENTARDTST